MAFPVNPNKRSDDSEGGLPPKRPKPNKPNPLSGVYGPDPTHENPSPAKPGGAAISDPSCCDELSEPPMLSPAASILTPASSSKPETHGDSSCPGSVPHPYHECSSNSSANNYHDAQEKHSEVLSEQALTFSIVRQGLQYGLGDIIQTLSILAPDLVHRLYFIIPLLTYVCDRLGESVPSARTGEELRHLQQYVSKSLCDRNKQGLQR